MGNTATDILKSNTARWIYFGPIFLIVYLISISCTLFVVTWLHGLAFPINGFMGFLFSGFVIMPMTALPFFYMGVLITAMKICPNYKIGARIIIFIIMVPVIHFYIFINNKDYSLTKTIVELILDIITFFTLAMMSLSDLSKSENKN